MFNSGVRSGLRTVQIVVVSWLVDARIRAAFAFALALAAGLLLGPDGADAGWPTHGNGSGGGR